MPFKNGQYLNSMFRQPVDYSVFPEYQFPYIGIGYFRYGPAHPGIAWQ